VLIGGEEGRDGGRGRQQATIRHPGGEEEKESRENLPLAWVCVWLRRDDSRQNSGAGTAVFPVA